MIRPPAIISRGATRAFTLIEVLCVCALLAVVAALGASALSGADAGARLRSAVGAVREADRRARLLAAGEGAVELAFDAHRGVLVTRRPAADGGEVLLESPVPAGVGVRLEGPASETIEAVAIGRSGRSRDYRALLSSDAGNAALLVAGLTGWSEVRGEDRP